jgi:hypothetical protein
MPLAALVAPAIAAVGGASSAAALGAAAIGAGASIYGSSQAKKANSRATAAANQANQANIAANRENRDYIAGLNQPKIAGGNAAFDMLLKELGVGQPAPARTSSYRSPTYRPPVGTSAQPAPRAPMSQPGAMSGQGGGGPANAAEMNAAARFAEGGGAAYTMPAPGTYSADDFGGPQGGNAGGGPDAGYAGGVPAQPQGGFDTGAYLNANPDVAQEFERLNSTPEGQATLQANGVTSPDDYAARHYETSGQAEGRQVQQYAPDPVDPNAAPDLMNARRPDIGPAPTFERREDIRMQDYGAAPDAASYYSNFEADPGAAYREKGALDAINAASAARGRLRSGDAAKALMIEGANQKAQEYNNWFNRQTQRLAADRGQFNQNRSFAGNLYTSQNARQDANFGEDRTYGSNLWDLNRQRSDANFNTDRGYQTNRADTRVNNLFSISNAGDAGIRNVTAAGNNFTSNAMDANATTANIAGNSAINRANANTDLIGGIGGAVSNVANAFTGGGRFSAPNLQRSNAASVPFDMATRGFINTPASIRPVF